MASFIMIGCLVECPAVGLQMTRMTFSQRRYIVLQAVRSLSLVLGQVYGGNKHFGFCQRVYKMCTQFVHYISSFRDFLSKKCHLGLINKKILNPSNFSILEPNI